MEIRVLYFCVLCGLRDGQVNRSEVSTRVCFCLCLNQEPQQTVTLAISLAAEPQKKNNVKFTYRHLNCSHRLLPVPRECGFNRHVGPFIRYISVQS
jgi:hypothetical protein